MERSTIFNGKIHYKWPFSIAMLVHQRVYEWDPCYHINGSTMDPMALPMIPVETFISFVGEHP